MYEATYLGELELTDETLKHYGVKGMKWRHRKGTTQSAMGSDPRYQKTYIVKPGEERARLNKLNPAGTRVKTTTTTKKTTSSSTTSSSSSSSKKKGSGSSKKAVKDILSRFKLTKSSGGKSSSSTTKKESTGKKSSGSSEKKESSSSKKESSGSKSSSSSKSEEKTATKQEPQVIEKTRVSEDYTRYLERQLGKANYSKLQNETIQDRIKTTDAQKKRKARGVRKIYTRS